MAITLSRPADTSPEPRRFRTWLRKILTGGQIVESCPSWCSDRHLGDDSGTLDDLQHGATLAGVEVDLSDWTDVPVAVQMLAPRIAVDPYSDDPARQVPHILLEVFPDEYTRPLNADQFAAVIAKVRGHLDSLESEVLPQLRKAIAENGTVR